MASSPAVAAEILHVRKAEEADLLAIHRIEVESFPSPWPYEAFERFLRQPGFLVAEADDGVVGYVVADIIASHGRPVGHIKNLAAHPDRREQGVGNTLLSRVMMVLTGGGVDSVKLEVHASNEGPASSTASSASSPSTSSRVTTTTGRTPSCSSRSSARAGDPRPARTGRPR